jgi:hypothetical protein
MFTLSLSPYSHISRRRFLQCAAMAAWGLAPTQRLRAEGQATVPRAASFGRARRCIQVFLSGGPSQLDLWDMKPEAPVEVRGELRPIETSVAGIQLSELLPHLARQVHRFRIVRSLTHGDTEHTTSFCTMLTGTSHPRPGVVQPAALPSDHPHLGAIYAHAQHRRHDLPPFVSLPTLFQPPGNGVWPGQTGGFLGRRYDPFVVHGDRATGHFRAPDVQLPADVSHGRLRLRRSLLERLEHQFVQAIDNRGVQEASNDYDDAFRTMASPEFTAAFDLEAEPTAVHEQYGRHLFGQGLLLARRLCEAGVPITTVYWVDPTPAGDGGGEWDSHGRIYHHLRERLVPPADRALAALFADLDDRGMFDDTLVMVFGEFGRTPRLNPAGGRDHWPAVQSILMAGAGIPGGTVVGASDRHGAYPAQLPFSPADLAQTVLHLLGVPADLEFCDQQRRPIMACRGAVIPQLLG